MPRNGGFPPARESSPGTSRVEKDLTPMPRLLTARRRMALIAAGLALLAEAPALGADAPPADGGSPTLDLIQRQADRAGRIARAWYDRTPPAERVTWGGLIAGAALGLGVAAERSL